MALNPSGLMRYRLPYTDTGGVELPIHVKQVGAWWAVNRLRVISSACIRPSPLASVQLKALISRGHVSASVRSWGKSVISGSRWAARPACSSRAAALPHRESAAGPSGRYNARTGGCS